MDIEDAKDLLREIAKYGTVALSKHCRKRMAERSVAMDDILTALLWGEVVDIEELEDSWKCTVEGNDIEGDELTIIAIVNEEKRAVCITVF